MKENTNFSLYEKWINPSVMSESPMISIIIPCYNVEKYIDRCLESIRQQTFGLDRLEIICLDDKSVDGTLERLHEWEQVYPDVFVIIELPDNGRQGRARNIGLSYATGEWVAYVDADDWLEPDYFKKMIDVADDFCDMVVCKAGRDDSDHLSYYDQSEVIGDDYAILIDNEEKRREISVLASIPFIAYCKLIRRDFLLSHNLFFPERLAYEDIFWGALLPYYVKKVVFVEKTLYHYFVNPASTVLAGNASHHPDMLTVNLMLWREYSDRGLYPKYMDEIEYNYIYTCYLAFLKVLALRYSEPEYSLFRILKELTLTFIPDWRQNRYIRNGDIKEFHLLLLELLDKDINTDTFTEVLDMIRKSGI